MERIKQLFDKHLQGDPVIWMVVFALSIFSIMVVYSATGTLAFKHLTNPESYLLNHTFLPNIP